MTKSREAYKSQKTAYLYRPSPTASRRSRPQSAGPSRGTNDNVDSTKHLAATALAAGERGGNGGGSGGVGGSTGENSGTGRGRPGHIDHLRWPPFVPPPPFSRRVDGMTPTTTAAGACK